MIDMRSGADRSPAATEDTLTRFVTEAPVPVAIFDSRMRYLAWSKDWAGHFGLQSMDLSGRAHLEFLQSVSPAWNAAFQRALGGDATACEEAEFQCLQDKEVWLRWCMRSIPAAGTFGPRVAIFVTDITERRLVEVELRRAEDWLQQITTSLGIGVFEHDFATGATTVSDSYLALLGLTRDMLPNTDEDWLGLLRPPDTSAYDAARTQALDAAGDGRFNTEIHPIVGGVERVMEVKSRVLFEGEGAGRRPKHLVGVTVDQTESRHLHEVLSRAQKLETVGRLAGMVAHDFNNILTVILANLELAGLRNPDDDLRVLLRNAADAAEMGAGFTKRLVLLAGGHTDRDKSITIDEHISQVWNVFQRVLSDGLAFRFHPGAKDAIVSGDTAEIDGAILNLVMNARDAQAVGGQIDLQTEVVDLTEAAAALIRGARAGRFVRISVRDRGAGIPDAVAARLGEPFVTTKAPGHGSGLGLTSVILTVERTGGFLQVASVPGGGTEMSIYLPVLDSVDHPAEQEPTEYPFGNGELILVVEDDPMVREAALLRLEAIGYAVIEAGTAEAALSLIDAGEPVDLVFSDVVLPGQMSGFSLARELRSRYPGIATLLTSGHVSAAIRKRDAMEPTGQLLTKPYPLHTLAEAVAAALRSVPAKV